MKLILAFVVLLSIVSSSTAVSLMDMESIDTLTSNPLLKNIISSAMEDPKGALELFNKILPMVKAFTENVDPMNTQSVNTYTYQWCLQSGQGYNVFCVDLTWRFIIGWRALQFTDDQRLYNLSVVPFAYMDVITNLTTEGDPVKFSIGPDIKFVHFQAPLSFELVDRNTVCYDGNLAIDPINVDAGIGATFLECEVMIPEDVQRCGYTEQIGARIFTADLNEGYYSSLLDRT